MAARLHRAKATVETGGDGQQMEGVSVSVRNNVATVRLGRDVLLERGEVARVVPRGRRSWTVTFDQPTDDGDVWMITDERRACCGRR